MFATVRRYRTIMGFLSVSLIAILAAPLVGDCGQKPAAPAYPAKPIEAVVAFAAGGSGDLLMRHLATYLQRKWGQRINVVNKPGAGGTPGTVSVLQSAPDGYTVGNVGNSNTFLNHAVQKEMPYRWDALNHIVHVAAQPLVLVVKADSKYGSLKDLVADMQKDPTQIQYGSSGVAGPSTFVTAQLAAAAGVDPVKLKRVPFDGGAPAAAAAAGGHVHFVAQNLGEVLELVKGKRLRALAIALPARWKELRDVPTFTEAGYASVKHMGVFGVYGPANLPAEVVKKWEDGVAEAVKDSQFVAGLEKIGAVPAYMNSKDLRAWIEAEYTTALAIAEKLGLRR